MNANIWTRAETNKLIALWPTHSAGQIGDALGKTRSAISGRAFRLGLPGTGKKLDHDPHKPRPRPRAPKMIVERRFTPPPEPVEPSDVLEMRPCSLLELEAGRCKWPLGPIDKIATRFCGAVVQPGRGRLYCPHHLQVARRE